MIGRRSARIPSLSLWFLPVALSTALVVAHGASESVSGARLPDRQTTAASACTASNVGSITVTATGGGYTTVTGSANPSAVFSTGQDADVLVSGIDFNTTGGSQLFNHPSGIASDGTKLAITDTFNNRVLIWNTPPASNVAPDVVLGQANFTTNNSGSGRANLNFPVSVSMSGSGGTGKLFVSDANNHRVLIWNTIPTVSGTAADVIITRTAMGPYNETWPWGIWSDGTKMVVAATQAGRVLIWNSVPTSDDVSPAFALDGRNPSDSSNPDLGTPRHVFSNGTMLLVGDHNATAPGYASAGTFVWNAFPTSSSSQYSFFRQDYVEPNNGPWMKGTFIDGALWGFGRTLYSWLTPPTSEASNPTTQLNYYDYMNAGDYGGVAYAGGKLYLASGNSNHVAGFNSLPTANSLPDFTIGSTGYCTNTLESNYIIQNGVPASNGTSLFVSSDFDRKLYVWSGIPAQSHPTPDYVFRLPFQPWDNALYGNTFALAGERTVYIWETLPSNGGMPSRQLRDTIGTVNFQSIKGVAMDASNFYVTDDQNDKLYVWNGLPTASSNPAFSISITDPWRVSSDGTYLVVTQIFSQQILIYQVAGLNASSTPIKIIGGFGGSLQLNLPQDAFVGNGKFFIADSGFNRVLMWTSLSSALAGSAPDVVLGEADLNDHVAEIGRNKSFSPGAVWYDGRFVWVGEFKFSDRLLRYGPALRFTDDPITAGTTTVKALHITEMRTRIDSLRSQAGLGAFTYSDSALTAGTTMIRAQHIVDLRTALEAVYTQLGLTLPTYTDSTLDASARIKAVHITELRAAIVAREGG